MKQKSTTNNEMYKKLVMLFIFFCISISANAQRGKSNNHTVPGTSNNKIIKEVPVWYRRYIRRIGRRGYWTKWRNSNSQKVRLNIHTQSEAAFLAMCNSDNSAHPNENFYVAFGGYRNWFHRVKFEVQKEGAAATRNGMFGDWGHLYLVGNLDNRGREHIVFGFGSNERSRVREKMRLTNDGNLGIGLTNPVERLEVNGSIRMHRGHIKDSGPMEFKADDDYSNDRIYKFIGYSNTKNNSGDSNYIVFDTKQQKNTINGTTTFKGKIRSKTIFADSLGIGIENPKEKLHIAGNVKAKSFIADASVFPDYVFSTTYALKPLHEIKKFVKTNKHLPGMPTEKEVVTNGLDIKKVTTVSVEKIEELYLHTIKQQELLEKQQQVIESLQKRLDAIEAKNSNK